jgi:hypothetical protein
MILTRSISNIFVTYFYYTKKFQILYLFYYKLNGEVNGFMFYLRIFYLLSFFYVKNCFIFQLDFGQTIFIFYFTMLSFYINKKTTRDSKIKIYPQ